MKEQRSSNIELLRIVLMFMIVVHHYCVNSGLVELMQWDRITGNTLLVQLMAIGGKVGVNGFFLISGFFMIHKTASWKKVVKLLAEVWFYNIIVLVFLTFLGKGYTSFELLKCFVPLVFSIDTSFVGCYLLIYLLSPVLNKCLKALNRKEYSFLLLVMLFYFSVVSTLHINMHTWNYFIWGIVVYGIGAYLRLFDIQSMRLPWGKIAMGSVLFIWGFILFADFCPIFSEGWLFTKWMFFLRLRIPCNPYVNRVAVSCLGVLMIHANGWPMIHWLWGDLLKNVEYYTSSYLWLHMLLSTVVIYAVCTLIDMLRIKYVETPLFAKLLKW